MKLGSVMTVAGASGAGKTTFVLKLLKQSKMCFNPQPRSITWYYGEICPKDLSSNIIVVKGLPDIDTIKEDSIIVLDDLFMESSSDKNVTNLFTRISHHRNCFVINITQNIFHQSSQNRTRQLNTHYLVIFKNPRDKLQIQHLQRQTCIPFLKAAFEDATCSSPYSYLLLDFHPTTPDSIRVRTGIFLGDDYYVYINNK
jgi:hypothetical protein